VKPVAFGSQITHLSPSTIVSCSRPKDMTTEQQDRPNLLVLALVFEGGMAVLAWALGFLIERPPFSQIGFTWSALVWGVAGALPLLLMLLALLRMSWKPIVELRGLVREMVVPMFEGAGWLQIAVISALAGLGEEMLFRGVIQEAISARFAPWLGLVSASILFGLAHPISKAYAVLAGVMGLYLGLLAIVTGNLLVPIIAHGFYDFIALACLLHGTGTSKSIPSDHTPVTSTKDEST
jgi:membrane protease YdiL (CAAX protease family)